VQCHFDVGMGPKLIRLHFVRDQVIAHEVAVRSLKRSAVSAIAS
jgi:hypothetical protein